MDVFCPIAHTFQASMEIVHAWMSIVLNYRDEHGFVHEIEF